MNYFCVPIFITTLPYLSIYVHHVELLVLKLVFDPAFRSYHLVPVQDGMAGTNTGVYEFDSVVRGLHIYKTVWTPLIDEMAQKCSSRKIINMINHK